MGYAVDALHIGLSRDSTGHCDLRDIATRIKLL